MVLAAVTAWAALLGRGDEAYLAGRYAEAAAVYDELVADGTDTPGLHRRRAQAHLLAGDLPMALLAYRVGRSRWPASGALRHGQEYARARVRWPDEGDLRSRAVPREPRFRPGRWVPLAYLQALAAAGYVAACFGVAARLIARRRGALRLAGVGFVLAAAAGWAALNESRRLAAFRGATFAVVDSVELLRRGNADAYPAVVETPLPVGVEVTVRHRRGGWVHVELADGTLGWLPAGAVVVG